MATYVMAESLAHLIDGYQMMFNQGQSIFKMKGLERCESHQLKVQQLINVSKGAGMNFICFGHNFLVEHELRVKREHVTLKELIGGGQFGNVYKGVLAEPVSLFFKKMLTQSLGKRAGMCSYQSL